MKKSDRNKTDVLVPVFIPKEYKHDDSLFIAVNGERILVRKGETVMLPARFAEVVENSARAAKTAEKFIADASGD